MSSWKWKLRRLAAMSPGEIAVRIWRAARDRAISLDILRPYPIAPRECFCYAWREDAFAVYRRFLKRFPCSRRGHSEWRDFLRYQYPNQSAAIIERAEAILDGRLRLLGFDVQTDIPPRWFRNYVQGGEWQSQPAGQIDYRRGDVAGGVRYCWELNRHGYFLTLAQAWFLTNKPQYAQRLLTDWLDWMAHNPPRFGVNWTSMLECALRVHTWCWSLWFLAECDLLDEPTLQTILGSLWQQTAEISMNLSVGSSANNHLIGEAAGMWTFSNLFPTARHANRWAQVSRRILAQEIPRQITPDGVTVEQAIHYQVFVMEMALHALSVAQAVGQPFGEEYTSRLIQAERFLQTISDSRGHTPHIGDSDDAEVLPLSPLETNTEATVLDAARALCEQQSPSTLKGAFLSAQPARAEAREKPHPTSCLFASGGYAVMRDEPGSRLAVVDCGELGWGTLAAHSHADALSITLSVDGQPILVDAGTYCYHDERLWRDAFRSTRYHNTVCVSGENQSEMLGAFLWGRRAKVQVYRWHTSLLADMLHASHDGYRRIGCGRHIRWCYWLKPDLWLTVDELEQGAGFRMEQCWLFSQACTMQAEGDRMQIRCAGSTLWLCPAAPVFVRQAMGADAAEGGWVSAAFEKKEPAPHLFLERKSKDGRVATVIALGDRAPELRMWKDETHTWSLHFEHNGRLWFIGFSPTPCAWDLLGATVRAKNIVATWIPDKAPAIYEVIE